MARILSPMCDSPSKYCYRIQEVYCRWSHGHMGHRKTQLKTHCCIVNEDKMRMKTKKIMLTYLQRALWVLFDDLPTGKWQKPNHSFVSLYINQNQRVQALTVLKPRLSLP